MSEPVDQRLAALFEKRKCEGARELRAAAWKQFARGGLPNRRVESWHYTDLRAALREIAPASEPTREAVALAQSPDRVSYCVHRGQFAAHDDELAKTPASVSVTSLRDALAQGDADVIAALAPRCDDAAVALNAALMQDGVVLRIAPGAQIEPAINFVTIPPAGEAAFTRNLVIVGEGARVTIVEKAQPLLSGAQENHVLVLQIGAGARVEHIADFCFGQPDTVRVHSLLATLGERSALNSHCLIWGGGLTRRQMFATLAGEGAEASFNGAMLLTARNHADTTLVVEHAAPHGKSRERFRTILDGEATGVFQGKTIVAPHAQKTDGSMQSKALLLSDRASMNNKPELEIFADDVVCGHGATCGRLDADQLFYLESRGLPHSEAEALLIEGFANEAFDDVANDALRAELSTRVGAWLGLRPHGLGLES
jgi:Fe-S cluster assembly protein SufD